MSSLARYGDGNEGEILNASVGAGSLAYVESSSHDMRGLNVTSAQLLIGGTPVQVAVSTGDAVVGSTGVWTFAAFTFTSYNGGLLVVSGAANAANNGVFPITGVSGATVTAPTSRQHRTATNETFTAVKPQMMVYAIPAVTVDGSWKVEVSNNKQSGNGAYGQAVDEGDWTDVTSQFSPSIAAVDHSTAASLNQYVQAELAARDIRYSFTRSAGTGIARVLIYSKSQG